jgi:hypothetical protein
MIVIRELRIDDLLIGVALVFHRCDEIDETLFVIDIFAQSTVIDVNLNRLSMSRPRSLIEIGKNRSLAPPLASIYRLSSAHVGVKAFDSGMPI